MPCSRHGRRLAFVSPLTWKRHETRPAIYSLTAFAFRARGARATCLAAGISAPSGALGAAGTTASAFPAGE